MIRNTLDCLCEVLREGGIQGIREKKREEVAAMMAKHDDFGKLRSYIADIIGKYPELATRGDGLELAYQFVKAREAMFDAVSEGKSREWREICALWLDFQTSPLPHFALRSI